MKEIKKVTGYKEILTDEIPEEQVIYGKDTVYVHTNFEKITAEFDGVVPENQWRYDETQYTYPEWSVLQEEQIQSLSTDQTNTEIALMELFEGGML